MPIPTGLDMTWEEQGKYYGYPGCCIIWFVMHAGSKLTPKQEAAHGYRGFIPCPTCAEKVTRETLHTLINNRECKTPFPIES